LIFPPHIWNNGILISKGILLVMIFCCPVKTHFIKIPHTHFIQNPLLHYSNIPIVSEANSLVSIHEFKMNTMGVQFRNEPFLF